MIQAIVKGREHPDWLADHAKGTLRGKRSELRLFLRELTEDREFVERRIERIEKAIAPGPNLDQVSRLCTIPGVDLITAWTIPAELGSDMNALSGPKHAASWAGLCPGNHESGGKRLSNRTRKGNRRLRRALCQSAWAATRKKNCFLAAFLLP